MHNATIYSFLVLENGKLPFPPEINYIKDSELEDLAWSAFGFPVHKGQYSVTSGMLYFEGLFGEPPKIEALDFTGEVTIGAFFVNPDAESKSHQVYFVVTFIKGKMEEVRLEKVIPIDTAHYHKSLDAAKTKIGKQFRRRASWWYKWLYTPYFFVIRFLGMVIFIILQSLNWILTKIVLFLTPI
jgi:hypothetical protein